MKKTKKKTEETMPEEKSPITDAAGGAEAPQEGDPADGGYPDEMVMEKLKGIDEVAYVRFASVYREFKDIQTFREELDRIQKGKENK